MSITLGGVYRDVVQPHFTMVFQVRDLAETVFSERVARAAASSVAIRFICRYAMLHNDASSDDYYVFLVPDEGFSGLARLHDLLYMEALASKLRLDIPYLPHIGIATLKDPAHCKRLADEVNHKHLAIQGTVENISVVEYDGKIVTDLHHFRLGGNAA